MPKQRTAEQLLDLPGESYVIEPSENPGVGRLLLASPKVAPSTDIIPLLRNADVPPRANPWKISAYDVRAIKNVGLTELQRLYHGDHRMPLWVFAAVVHREISGRDETLIGDGRMNLFWVPHPIVVFEERIQEIWRIEPAGARLYERYDRVFFG